VGPNSTGRGPIRVGNAPYSKGTSQQKSGADDSRNWSGTYGDSGVVAPTTHYAYRAWTTVICGLTFLGTTGVAIYQAFGR
jgi:hypothetical protein